MYSIMPAFVSALFLMYGVYVLVAKGFTPASLSFAALCFTTFFWQGTWALLFQTHDPHLALLLTKIGYLLIIFLPTSLYLFLVEVSSDSINVGREHIYVACSYVLAVCLAISDLYTNYFIAGYYQYFFGDYPKAGPLHVVHLMQTMVVVIRGLYIAYRAYRVANPDNKKRLRLCLVGLFIYFLAAIDYLANYGFEFYPPGIIFITISLGIIAVAVFKYQLMSPYTLAATIAHELRTPLATMQLQASELSRNLSLLNHVTGTVEKQIDDIHLDRLNKLPKLIIDQINKTNMLINILLASATLEKIDTSSFSHYSAQTCIQEALSRYPFTEQDKSLVKVEFNSKDDFQFYGSDTLLIFVLFNLIKNALYAIKAANKGTIHLSCIPGEKYNTLCFMDTGPGIPKKIVAKMFDEFYSTKRRGEGSGIGLYFCKSVMAAFAGNIECRSVEGHYTEFLLHFPSEGLQKQPANALPKGVESVSYKASA